MTTPAPSHVRRNLIITVLNKVILQTYKLPFPLTLSFWHYAFTWVGTLIATRDEPVPVIDTTARRNLIAFSLLFNLKFVINKKDYGLVWVLYPRSIVLSNVSLNMVSMAMHQVR